MVNRILILLTILTVIAYSQNIKIGKASYYTTKSCQREGTSGILTANGETYDEDGLTCALRNRKFGTRYKVTNLRNRKSVIVRHNDYGPNKSLSERGRIIDLSKGAFKKISPLMFGIIKVKVEEIK